MTRAPEFSPERPPRANEPAKANLSPNVSQDSTSPIWAGALEPVDLVGRVVLLATDGSPASAAAALVANALANEHRAVVQGLSVLDTRPAPIPPPLDLLLAITDATTGPAVHESQVAVLRSSISATIGAPVDWPLRVTLGTPASVIAHEAKRIHASLIVMGLRRHGAMDRVVHDETTLGVIQHAGCPVLGVAEGMTGSPKKVLAAIDFGRASVRAARRAAMLLAPGGTVLLAYVPKVSQNEADEGEAVINAVGVDEAFEQVERTLATIGVRTDHVVLHHQRPRSIAEMLLEHADASHADLIAAGSARHGRLDRILMGSVSTELVRDGRRSVLVVPPADPQHGRTRVS